MNTSYYDTQDVCEILDLPYYKLEYWIVVGLVKPMLETDGEKWHKKFSDDDLTFLKKIKALTDQGILVSRAAEIVRGCRLPEVSWRETMEQTHP